MRSWWRRSTRAQRNDTTGSIELFKRGWDDFRLRPNEMPPDKLVRLFSLMIGTNYLEQLEKLNRMEEAQEIRKEIKRIEASL